MLGVESVSVVVAGSVAVRCKEKELYESGDEVRQAVW